MLNKLRTDGDTGFPRKTDNSQEAHELASFSLVLYKCSNEQKRGERYYYHKYMCFYTKTTITVFKGSSKRAKYGCYSFKGGETYKHRG